MPRNRRSMPPTHTCTFRVRILGGFYAPPGSNRVWRDIELRGDQTLADLGQMIPPAFGFTDEHLWSFFLSGKPWDQASEYALVPPDDLSGAGGGGRRLASRLRVRDAPAGREFLFLFDYGDEWHFGVRLTGTGDVEPGASYPRVVASHGEAPPQYPDAEEAEADWDGEDEETLDEDEDQAAFQEQSRRLLAQFDQWAGHHGAAGGTAVAGMLLDWKWSQADGQLARWTADDLHECLLDWCPHHFAVPDEELEGVVPGVSAFLRFLHEARLLDPGGDQPGALDATLDWIGPRFLAAMRDPSRFGPAKAALQAMQAEGVNLQDEREVDRFLAGWQVPPEIRLPEQGLGEVPSFPPVALPSLPELHGAAAAAPWVRRLRQLTEWVGTGRPLTATGNLRVADAKDLAIRLGLADPAAMQAARVRSAQDLAGLNLTLGWAKRLHLVRVHQGRLVGVKQQRRLLDDPLELCSRAFGELPQLGEALPPTGMLAAAFSFDLAGAITDLLAGLYAANEAQPVTLGDLAAHVWEEHLIDRVGASASDSVAETWRLATTVEVARLLDLLQDLGMGGATRQ